MTPTASITFRRAPLGELLTSLPSDACRVFFSLARGACPRTGRVWTNAQRLAEDLQMLTTLIEQHLTNLVAAGHLSLWTRGTGGLRCYTLGPVFVLEHGAPANLPVEPEP